MSEAICYAEIGLRDAQQALVDATRSTYPIGCRVVVEKGRSTFTAEVTGYGAYWSSAGEIQGFNIKTGNFRSFYHSEVQGLAK